MWLITYNVPALGAGTVTRLYEMRLTKILARLKENLGNVVIYNSCWVDEVDDNGEMARTRLEDAGWEIEDDDE